MMGRQAMKRELFLSIKPRQLVGDTNYGVAAMVGWLVDEKRIAPHVPVWDKSEHHDGTFSRTDFPRAGNG